MLQTNMDLKPLDLPKLIGLPPKSLPSDSQTSTTLEVCATSTAISFLSAQVSYRMSLLEDSHANPTALQAYKKLKRMTGISGDRARESLGSFDPDLRCLKMLGAYSHHQMDFFSTALCQTWPRFGMAAAGKLFPLQPLAHPMSETESGSCVPMKWPTPCATDYKGSGKNGVLRDRLDYAVERGATKSKFYSQRTDGKLNPAWVEWLMGFPIGWTDLNL